jgi:predicted methyltransferase
MAAVGLERRRRWPILYGAKKKPLPNTVSLYGPRDVEVVLPDPPHGEPVTQAILGAVVRPGMVVLDPCTGLGMTARLTHRFGGVFRGTELNPVRLERTAAWLRKRAPAS